MSDEDRDQLLLLADVPHLISQPHVTQIDAGIDMDEKDIHILREIAKEYAEIASNTINDERKLMWRRLNDLQQVRPLIWLTELCWNEMNVDDELTLRTSNKVAKRIEMEMRKTIYAWRHMQGDMIVEKVFYSPFIIKNSGFGIKVLSDTREVDVIGLGERADAVRRHDGGGTGTSVPGMFAASHFYKQIETEEDLAKIRNPVIEVDRERTEAFFRVYSRIFNGIMPVKKRGAHGFWFAPWDDLCAWMEPGNMLEGLALRPDFMHKAIRRTVDAYMSGLEQYEKLGLLARNDCNVRIGSGAYGYTKEIPVDDAGENSARTTDMWGSSVSQIFGSVSPRMHEEFGLSYEMEWLKKFNRTYYGCCEALHGKIDILSRIPNLRKISVSPWANVEIAAEKMKGRYVASLKPSPCNFARDNWNVQDEMDALRQKLRDAKDCNVEVVLKDIISVRLRPQRIWKWVSEAEKVVREFE
jgi:hypothetical protein